MRNHSNKNDFDLHEIGREGGTHFRMNCFACRLVLKWAKGNSEMAHIECRKTKTKVVTLANHKSHAQSIEPIKT